MHAVMLALLVAVSACGAPATRATQALTEPSAPTPTTGSRTSSTVVDTDSGRTVFLRSGQLLKVHLSNGTWDPPVSSAPGVVQRQSSTGGYPTSAPVAALFQAVASGSADVTATSDAACFHTSPRCLMPTRQWTLHVVVR